jgi:tripartite-type tricarboxylate transporter receptor subunit TctC
MEEVVVKSISCLAVFAMLIVSSLLMVGSPVTAADYPTKPITIICPMAAGGEGDLHARAFAASAEKILGQPVVVVNRTGST